MRIKKAIKRLVILACMYCCVASNDATAQNKIDRLSLVKRHNVVNIKADTLSSLSVGNGSFAFTADITGMQSFPDAYAAGVSIGHAIRMGLA